MGIGDSHVESGSKFRYAPSMHDFFLSLGAPKRLNLVSKDSPFNFLPFKTKSGSFGTI
jgi:hypothetical protein